MFLQQKYAIPPDVPLPREMNLVDYNFVKAQLGDWKPDLVICYDAGTHWRERPTDGFVAHVATDPHVLSDFYVAPRKYSDKFFSMQKVYAASGDEYLPYAFDKGAFYPDDTVARTNDCVLIGMPYEQRINWVNDLRSRGLRVHFENAPIFDKYRNIQNTAPIGLNWSSLDDLNCRAFELLGMRRCAVMNKVTDLGLFFEDGKDFLQFTTQAEATEKVLWAMANPEKAQEIANNGNLTAQNHTFDHRVEQILQSCGFV
jgi:hypothetical protein